MINTISDLWKLLLSSLPFLILVFLDSKANVKKPIRYKQFFVPIFALLYCIVVMVFLTKLGNICVGLLNRLPELLLSLAAIAEHLPAAISSSVGDAVTSLSQRLAALLARLNPVFYMLVALNTAAMLAFLIIKKLLLVVFKRSNGGVLFESVASLVYAESPIDHQWYVKETFHQARSYLKCIFLALVALCMCLMCASYALYRNGMLSVPFYPVFAIIVVGELYFFLDGLTETEAKSMLSGEADRARSIYNYVVLRKKLSQLFGDKLVADNTTVSNSTAMPVGNDTILTELEHSGDEALAAYVHFMRKKLRGGIDMDQNYLRSGASLLQGENILFNNPFYYDLIPYAFFAMDRVLLQHKKVLIVLGRHGTEKDIETWCNAGFKAISGIPSLWRVRQLNEDDCQADIGIISRSDVHNIELHKKNVDFLSEVGFMLLIEPSRLLTTAQVGLNSIVRHCKKNNGEITFCFVDKNCDGLVDALSHVLMAHICEVSPTQRHKGICSYMCWLTDEEHLQHRMLPNLSRYLGIGTELSFAALKNQVRDTAWYGGDRFPVKDIRWIAKQYYYDLLHYAELPTTQETMDHCFRVSYNMWNEQKRPVSYLTVEDESNNMFELKRNFATRANEQSFINVISADYLLRDYMAENDGVFNTDSKAIPYIVADYARTIRNVALRLCLRLSTEQLSVDSICHELSLVGIDTNDFIEHFWQAVCDCCQPIGSQKFDEDGKPVLVHLFGGTECVFSINTVKRVRKYCVKSGQMEDLYYIDDPLFKQVILSDLQSARYVAEDEENMEHYLGMELNGHVFQRYLPGQFLTFCGKYYEMQSVTADHHVIVRRAADHIMGRPEYRQVRNYILSNTADVETMGSCRTIGGMRLTRLYADFMVETPAYWEMQAYQDFEKGKYVEVSGIPNRSYLRKQILKLEMTENVNQFTPEVRNSLAILLNEVFRTLFAENQCFIAAVTPGAKGIPFTNFISGTEEFTLDENAIYLIEDSQLDIGLLVAVERNLNRIFSIICDYLDWHFDALDRSLNPPPAPLVPDYTVDEEVEEIPSKFFPRLWYRICKWFEKLKEFFKRLFEKLFQKRDKKKKEQIEPATDLPGTNDVIDTSEKPDPDSETEKTEDGEEKNSEASADVASEEALEMETPDEIEETQETSSTQDSEDSAEDKEEQENVPALMNYSYSSVSAEAEQSEENAEPEESEKPENGATLEFEKEKVLLSPGKMTRKPYHERYYLLFGGDEVPASLNLEDTLEFLKHLGHDNGEMKQVREGKNIAELIEAGYQPNKSGVHYCDFCGDEIIGTSFDLLADGRERCNNCSRTVVKSEREFVEIYDEILKNMECFFGARITVPIRVQMVNSKTLHRRLGKTFVPTAKADGRILGVAIKEKKKGYSILVENGAPRLASIMTIAHELTHIWQYLNWNAAGIRKRYGGAQELQIYEGMAKWSEIQYAFLIGEPEIAKRAEMQTRERKDAYGEGFKKYAEKYLLSYSSHLNNETPFDNPEAPL